MEEVMEKIFLLGYHMDWGHEEILDLDKLESEWYLDRVLEQKKREVPK